MLLQVLFQSVAVVVVGDGYQATGQKRASSFGYAGVGCDGDTLSMVFLGGGQMKKKSYSVR